MGERLKRLRGNFIHWLVMTLVAFGELYLMTRVDDTLPDNRGGLLGLAALIGFVSVLPFLRRRNRPH
jgi:hypothetical protein